jgi:hypothetical protein
VVGVTAWEIVRWLLLTITVLALVVVLVMFCRHAGPVLVRRGEVAEAPEAYCTDRLACGCARAGAPEWFCIYCMAARCDPHACNDLARAEATLDPSALLDEIYAYLEGPR